MIEVKGLSKRFDTGLAVEDLSFSVGSGEVLGFLGPNGAGKSTTMKMITGFLRPTSGSVSINGFDVQTHPLQAKRQIGYLPEGAPGYGEMTVLQFLEFIADIRGLKGQEREKRLQSVIRDVHLRDVLAQRIDTLSKGFRRRAGLAQAIIHDPEVLILDEPTDGLDPNQKHEVRNLIRGMSGDKIIVISTHILEEVEAVCTRAMIIGNGHLLADASPEQLASRSRYHGAVTLSLANLDNAPAQIEALPEVAAVEVDEQHREVTALPKDAAVLLPIIGRMIEQRGWQVESLYQQRGRLDEVFRDITEGAEA